jgi:hypothetical protein
VRRWLTSWGGAPAGLVVLGALVSRLPGFVHQLFDPDEAAIATMGMVVARGGTLYRDVADRKPPLAPFLYAASFIVTGSRDLRPLHVLAALEIAVAALVCAAEVRRRAGAAAGWWTAGLLIAGAVARSAVNAQAANFSHLALLPACVAIVAARWGTRRSAVLAGFMLGLAILTRQTWVIGILPAAYAAWWHGGRRVGRAAALVATTVLTVVAVGLTVPFGPFLRWTFTDNGSLLFDLAHSQSVGTRAIQALAFFLIGHLVLSGLALGRGWRRDEIDLWLWLVTGLIAVAAGFRFFGHYWLQVLPPLCLLAGPVAAANERVVRYVLATGVALTTGWFWVKAWTPATPTNAAPLVAEVREDTTPHERISVWGSFPEIYWESGRAPAGGLVISDFLVGKSADIPNGRDTLPEATPGALSQYMTSMNADPPELFIDTSTAGIRNYRDYPVSLVPPVERFLRAHYRRVETVDRVALYRLVSRPRPRAAGPIRTLQAAPARGATPAVGRTAGTTRPRAQRHSRTRAHRPSDT